MFHFYTRVFYFLYFIHCHKHGKRVFIFLTQLHSCRSFIFGFRSVSSVSCFRQDLLVYMFFILNFTLLLFFTWILPLRSVFLNKIVIVRIFLIVIGGGGLSIFTMLWLDLFVRLLDFCSHLFSSFLFTFLYWCTILYPFLMALCKYCIDGVFLLHFCQSFLCCLVQSPHFQWKIVLCLLSGSFLMRTACKV